MTREMKLPEDDIVDQRPIGQALFIHPGSDTARRLRVRVELDEDNASGRCEVLENLEPQDQPIEVAECLCGEKCSAHFWVYSFKQSS